MAPNFALFLSPEGIALAHRQTGGHWAVLGDTPLDVPDLGAAIVVLRKLAEARVGKDFETLVILPDDQVLYTSLTAPGPDEDTRLWQIRDGLEGLTPYAVEDLVFDWVEIEDGRVKLAVVAQETLDEAREFARQHGFVPAGFGARPLDNRFAGIAHFDRTPDWIASIPDIEFGRDTWQTEQATAQSAAGSTAVAQDTPAPGVATVDDVADDAADDAAGGDDPADGLSADPTAPDASDNTADGTAPVSEPVSEPVSVPVSVAVPQDAPVEEQEKPADDETPAPKTAAAPPRRLTLTAADAAADATAPPRTDEAGAPDTGPEPQTDLQTGQEDTPDAAEAPIRLPAGFGAHRKRTAPDSAGALVLGRKSRFGPGVLDEPAAADPDLPRKKGPGAADSADPALGRTARDTAKTPQTTSAQGKAERSAKKGKPAPRGKAAKPTGKPERPSGAGPQPDLPPLARVKSRIEEGKTNSQFGPNPFDGPPPGPGRKPSLRDRVTGIGRQGQGGAASPSRRGSGIGDKLRGLARNEDKAPQNRAGASLASATPPTTDHDAPKTAAKPDRAGVEATADIAPPAADTSRKRFTPPRRNPQGARIADADAPIMGGLLARDSILTQRGPSLRGGLILTLILLAVLALLGLWAAVYLPQTALGRWMGLGDDAPVIIVETEPAQLDPPRLGGDAPLTADAPPGLAALPAEDGAPEAALTPPQAPELLPDIDAEELDLGPAPVASPVIDPETVLPSPEENANFYARTGIWQRPPVITPPAPDTRLEEVIFVGLDPVVIGFDAYALPEPDFTPAADLPRRQSNPLSPETALALGDDGLVEPSEEGTLNPDGILVYAGPPSVLPQPRPDDAPAALAAAEAEAAASANGGVAPGAVDTALLRAVRPETRPGDLVEQRERAVLGGITYGELAAIRPEARPQSVQEQAAAEAEASAQTGDVTGASALAVAASFVPSPRPGNIEALVEEARASSGDAATASVAANRSDTIEPDIPSSASVTRAATAENAINLRALNLIGVSGTSSQRRALVRLPSGRFVTVEVGDRLDGGQVAAIGESSLQYVKRGRTLTLEVPTG